MDKDDEKKVEQEKILLPIMWILHMLLLGNLSFSQWTDSSQVPGVLGLKWTSTETSPSDSHNCLVNLPFVNLNGSLLKNLLGRGTILRKKKKNKKQNQN